jgi:hypothetical protein
MIVPAQGPITIYAPKPVSVRMFPPSGGRPNFRSKFKLVLSVLLTLGVGAGFYSLADEVRGVIAQGGSAVTLEQVLDESFNLSLAGSLEGSRLISTTSGSNPLVISSDDLVENLNADLLDGQTGSYYTDLFDAPADTSGWVDDGTVVRLRTSTDRVGIGTSSPESSLHLLKSENSGSQASFKAALIELNLNANDADPFNSYYTAVQGRSRYYGSDTGGSPEDIGHVRGVFGSAFNYGTGTLYASAGVQGSSFVASSGDITEASGVTGIAGIDPGGSGSIDRAIAFYTPGVQNTSTGAINNAYGLLVGGLDGDGSVTNNYGIFIENPSCSGCTNVWALYSEGEDNYFGGDVEVGGVTTINELLKTTANSTNTLNMLNNGISLESYFGISMNIDNDDDDSGEDFRVVTNGAANVLFLINDAGVVGIGTDTPDQGQVEVKGGTVCIDDDNDDDATSCIASESDVRLKTNIAPIEGALDKLLSIRGVEFDWRWNDPEVLAQYPLISRFESQPHSLGVIAQEVATVFPEVIMAEKAGGEFLQVDYSRLVPPMIEAIRELSAKVSSLSVDGSGSLTSSGEIVIPAKLETEEGVFEKLTASVLGTFEKIVAKAVEITTAAVDNLKVKFLTIGESSAPTGFTIYDRATGEPYCVSVFEGEVVTEAGICE